MRIDTCGNEKDVIFMDFIIWILFAETYMNSCCLVFFVSLWINIAEEYRNRRKIQSFDSIFTYYICLELVPWATLLWRSDHVICGVFDREHSKKFKPEDMQIQIEGKNCVVTGANSGIGYAAAEGLASRLDFLVMELKGLGNKL